MQRFQNLAISSARDRHPVRLTLLKIGNYWFTVAAIVVAIFLSGKLAISLVNLGPEVSPIWFPSGFALAALLLYGRRMWVAVSIAVFLLALSLHATWTVAAVAALGNTTEVVVADRLLRRWGVAPTLTRLRDVFGFVWLAVLVAPVTNATISSFNAAAAGMNPWAEFGAHWWMIWRGDGIGLLVVTPLIVSWLAPPLPKLGSLPNWLEQWQQNGGLRRKTIEFLIWMLLLPSISCIVFNAPVQSEIARYPLEYVPFTFIVWAALRFGQRGTVLSSFVVSSFAFWGLVQHSGPFPANFGIDPHQAVLLLQTFIGIVTVTALVLAAAVTERQQAAMTLQFAAERERLLVETAQRIRRSLNLQDVLDTTVAEVRQLLQADRVFIVCLERSGRSRAVAESVDPHWRSVLGWVTGSQAAQEIQQLFHYDGAYEPPLIRVVNDTEQIQPTPFLAEYYRYCQVRAGIGIPLMVCGQLFGVLIVNQCSSPREWRSLEIDLLQKLATQVEIAVQQGQLYQHVQTLAVSLEGQVQERTAELQQRMQELQHLNQVKDLLLHAVAHDLRTPMQGMLMVLNKLRRQDTGTVPVPCAKLDRIIQSCDHQLQLLNSLLEGHAPDQPPTPLQPQPVAIHDVVCTVLASLTPLLESSRTTIANEVDAQLPPVNADPGKLQQVFDSLLSNAVKHNPPGITVTIDAIVLEPHELSNLMSGALWPALNSQRQRQSEAQPPVPAQRHIAATAPQSTAPSITTGPPLSPAGDAIAALETVRLLPASTATSQQLEEFPSRVLCCTVTDSGQGMTQTQCDRLFELYIRGANNCHLTGIGLGLHRCRKIILAHGGEIGVLSCPGVGSQFWFTLPLAVAEPNPPMLVAQSLALNQGATSS